MRRVIAEYRHRDGRGIDDAGSYAVLLADGTYEHVSVRDPDGDDVRTSLQWDAQEVRELVRKGTWLETRLRHWRRLLLISH